MNILILSLGNLMFIGALVFLFQRLKMLYKTKPEPFWIVAGLFVFLMMFGWVSFLLTELLEAVLSAAGSKMPSAPRLYSVEWAWMRGCIFVVFVWSVYLFAVLLPTMAINRRRQRKELARLGWQERKPGATLDAKDFKHLFIIGITSWKSEDLRGIETLQHRFQHDDWTVQILFLDDTDAWPTPTVREYQDGVLVRHLSGKEALTWMKQA